MLEEPVKSPFVCPAADAALRVAKLLMTAGFEAFLVGGCVRDLLMGRIPKDYDIATSATPEQVTSVFPDAMLVGAQFGVVIVPQEGHNIEVATFREETDYSDRRRPDSVRFSTAERDAQRRDFTVNGLFMNPVTHEVIDYVGGLHDLHGGLLKAIGDPDARLSEDALRLLRAVRFASTLRFKIESATWEAVCRNAGLIVHVSAERIRDELVRGLTGPSADQFLQLLSDSGLLALILPEAEALKGCEQPPEFHPEGDVFVHTKLVLRNLPEAPGPELAMAALLHDIGKPPTFNRSDRIRFNGHDKAGAEIADRICRRLAFSNDQRERIISMVARHMQFINFPDMRPSTMRRFLAAETIEDELELHRADSLGSNGSLSTYELARRKLAEVRAEFQGPRLPAPLINGNDLMDLGLRPGPAFKSILQRVYDEQLEKRFEDRNAALRWLAENLEQLQIQTGSD